MEEVRKKVYPVFKFTDGTEPNVKWYDREGYENMMKASQDTKAHEFKNYTIIKVPKKYHHMIGEIHFEKGEGYWIHTNKGYCIDDFGCHTGHEVTQKDVLDKIRTIEPCDCEFCGMN